MCFVNILVVFISAYPGSTTLSILHHGANHFGNWSDSDKLFVRERGVMIYTFPPAGKLA